MLLLHPQPSLEVVVWPLPAHPLLLKVTSILGSESSEDTQSTQDPRGRESKG